MKPRKTAALIVPVRDRRQGKRYLTVRNLRNAAIAVAVIFALVTIRSEMRKPQPGNFGGLFAQQVPQAVAPLDTPVEIVQEAPPAVPEHERADAMLIASAAREQYLGVNGTPAPAPAAEPAAADFRREPILGRTNGKVAIVGDASGVAVVQTSDPNRPKLSGGFMR